MSQSAESQSAIVENENNTTIVQAVLAVESDIKSVMDTSAVCDAGKESGAGGENEETMEVDGGADDVSSIAANDARQTSEDADIAQKWSVTDNHVGHAGDALSQHQFGSDPMEIERTEPVINSVNGSVQCETKLSEIGQTDHGKENGNLTSNSGDGEFADCASKSQVELNILPGAMDDGQGVKDIAKCIETTEQISYTNKDIDNKEQQSIEQDVHAEAETDEKYLAPGEREHDDNVDVEDEQKLSAKENLPSSESAQDVFDTGDRPTVEMANNELPETADDDIGNADHQTEFNEVANLAKENDENSRTVQDQQRVFEDLPVSDSAPDCDQSINTSTSKLRTFLSSSELSNAEEAENVGARLPAELVENNCDNTDPVTVSSTTVQGTSETEQQESVASSQDNEDLTDPTIDNTEGKQEQVLHEQVYDGSHSTEEEQTEESQFHAHDRTEDKHAVEAQVSDVDNMAEEKRAAEETSVYGVDEITEEKQATDKLSIDSAVDSQESVTAEGAECVETVEEVQKKEQSHEQSMDIEEAGVPEKITEGVRSGVAENPSLDDDIHILDEEIEGESDLTEVCVKHIKKEPFSQACLRDVRSVQEVNHVVKTERQVKEEVVAKSVEQENSADNGQVNMVDSHSAHVTSANSDITGEGITSQSKDGSAVDKKSVCEDDDDVVVVEDDDDEPTSDMKENKKELFNTNNDMGIQIESVSGGADELHKLAEQNQMKQGKGDAKNETSPSTPALQKKGPLKLQTCIVCKRVVKCRYNIVRNGDIKHLCDDSCFNSFRSNPSLYLRTTVFPVKTPASNKKQKPAAKAAVRTPRPLVPTKELESVYKTCVVCQIMNINAQGQFCMWKDMDFCGEGCLGKYQAGISTSCTLCSSVIPLTARSANCLKIANTIRPFCSPRCALDYKLRMRLCTLCKKDLATVQDSSFSAPVGSDGIFHDFCSQTCMKKYEDQMTINPEILQLDPGRQRGPKKCSVCQKNEVVKHVIRYSGILHNLCSDPCLSAFRYANKLIVSRCDCCKKMSILLEPSPFNMVFGGSQKTFCSDVCQNSFRCGHSKSTPCYWCGSHCDNFDMIDRLDSNSKHQLFCSLNCLSLFRVNLQAKSNQSVTCDQCSKYTPAHYHLTMSDASVRNFCSYNCVMNFQAQFSKMSPPSATTQTTSIAPPHKHNTRGKASVRVVQETSPPAPVPIISNVISLAQPEKQKASPQNNPPPPVVASDSASNPKAKAASSPVSQPSTTPVQQKIIIQPPPPKVMKNKSIMCRPIVHVKATSCRPYAQSKECQTERIREKPAFIPVPVPVYLPTPMAMYTAPSPTPVFIPIPIPVPVFIPTTRKSADGILKQIKEIQEKTPSDPLEAELLMMAAAVSGEGKNSTDSESDNEMLPELTEPKRRQEGEDDERDTGTPMASGKDGEGGEEDMISMALRMAEEMSTPDLESAVEAVPINTEPPVPAMAEASEAVPQEDMVRSRRGTKRNAARRGPGRPPKRQRVQEFPTEQIIVRQEPAPQPGPPADADCHLKFTYGVNAWRHWVILKNAQLERNKAESTRVRLFRTDILQCTADELNFSLCLFVKEVRKPNGEEYSPDSIYYLTLGIQRYLFENGRIDNIFADHFYERFTDCLTDILSKCQPKFNANGQMVCRIEEEHLWECKQLGAHSPYVLLNTLVYFHTKYFMLKTPQDHMKLSFAHILKYWKKGNVNKGGQPTRSVSLRYYSVSTAKKDGSAPTSSTKKGSKEGIPVYEVTENLDNPLRCPVKLYEFFLSKCSESIKNRSDIFYPVPERSCVPDSPVWFSTMPISPAVMTKMLTRILLVREIQEAHLHAQPIFV